MRRILVLRGGALGDFLVTLPSLALLRQRLPSARIEFAGNATAAAIALSRGLIDAAHSQNELRWSALFSSAPLPSDFAAWLNEFDLVLSFWPDPDSDLARHFPTRPEQTFITAPAHPALAPAAAHFCAPLSALGLTASESIHYLVPPIPAAARRAASGAPRIALHPGSGSPRKNWPLDRWATLAAWLVQEYCAELFVISGEAEPPGVLVGIGTPWHAQPLEDLITELARCTLFLGHDSGVSHLAAATRTPCVLLFGPTDPMIWAPPAPHIRVLRRDATLTSISLADAKSAVAAALADQT